MDIQFVTGNTNEQLRILVQNRIALKMYELFAAVENVNYISIVTITGSGSSRSVGIAFMAKKLSMIHGSDLMQRQIIYKQ